MIKRMIVLVVVLALLFVAGCADTTASLWNDREGAIGGRLGYVMENTEVGTSILYWPDGDNSEVFGAYGMYKFPDTVEIPNPIPMAFLPETLKGTPYIGGKVNGEGGSSLLIAGIEIGNTLYMEFDQDNYYTIGLKHKF